MFDVLTINIATELFGLFFCLVCIAISAFSRTGKGAEARAADDIRNLFACDAFVMFSDSMAGIFRGRPGTLAALVVRACNFSLFTFNFIMFALIVTLITHTIPSENGLRFRRIATGIVLADLLMLIWNVFSERIYIIDDRNVYHRGPLFALTQIAGIGCVILGALYILQYRRKARRRLIIIYSILGALCIGALILQIFVYGIAWLNIAVLMGLVVIFVFNQMSMAESLADKKKIIAEQKLALEQSRIQLMVSQIKPHFLYNTLTSIAQLCDESPEMAREATVAFANYLRGNMRSMDQVAPIPFEEELTHIRNYLKIEEIRFAELLNVEYDIETTHFQVPGLSVQPLIENAVKHGVGQKMEGGTVRLSVRETDDAYVVTVSDDGVGFDTEQPRKESAQGLKNIRSRLARLCHAKLTITSKPGEGTTAEIRIPKKFEAPASDRQNSKEGET